MSSGTDTSDGKSRRSDGLRQRHLKTCAQRGSCKCPWTFQVELRSPEVGRRRQVTKGGFATLREAKEARAEVLRQDTQGVFPTDRRITVAQYLERWFTWRTEQHEEPLRPSTQVGYRVSLDRYLLPRLGNYRLAELRAAHIETAFHDIRKQYPAHSSRTRQLTYAVLRSALRHAVRTKIIGSSPCDQVDLGFRVTRAKPAIWQPEQLGAFLAYLDGLADGKADRRLAPLFRLAALTGLRRGEALGLRWQDVSLDQSALVVAQQLVTVGHAVHVGPPKTKAGERRVVALDATTVSSLRSWKAQQAVERLAWGAAWTDTGLVFTREDGAAWHPERITKMFTRLVKASGLPPMRLHDLRHLSASLQIAAGVPLAVVSKRLGHSTIGITVDTYGHLLGDANQNAAEAAASLIPARSNIGS